MRLRKSGSTKRALTNPSRPTTKVAGIGNTQPSLPSKLAMSWYDSGNQDSLGSQIERFRATERVAIVEDSVGTGNSAFRLGLPFFGVGLVSGMITTVCAPDAFHPVLGLDHGPHIQPSIRAPMAADQTSPQLGHEWVRYFRLNHSLSLMQQQEQRHRLARPWRVFAAAVLVTSRALQVDRLAISWKNIPPRSSIGLSSSAQTAFHVTAFLERLLQPLGSWLVMTSSSWRPPA